MPMRSHSAGSQASSTCRIKPGGGDGLVFDAHRLGERENVFLVALVVAIAAIDFEARRRGRREEHVFGPGGRDGDVDLLLELGLADIGHRPRAGLDRALLRDLRAGHVEQRAALVGIAVEVGELFAILALLDERLSLRLVDVGEAAEALEHVAQPVAALGIFAFVDDVDADLALPRDDGGHIVGEPGVVANRNALVEGEKRQAADMGGENFGRAAPHR